MKLVDLFHPFWLLLILPFILAEDDGKTTLRKPGGSTGCAFYCLLQPYKWEVVNFTEYRNLPCSHIIYGYGTVGEHFFIDPPTVHDISPGGGRNGNFENLFSLKFDDNGDPSRDIKFYYGISGEKLDFVDDSYMRNRVAKSAMHQAYQHQFNGIFLYLDHDNMFSIRTVLFVRRIKEEMLMYKNYTKFSMELVIGFPASRVPFAERRFADFEPYVDAYYLNGAEVPSLSDPNIAIGADPIFSSGDVPKEDAISHNAGILLSNGIPKNKLIIGLSAWTRSYTIPNERKTTGHNLLAAGPGKRGNRTHSLEGKLGYDETCYLVNDEELNVDRGSSIISFVHDRTWYSFNQPGHEAFLKKLNWISDNGFVGVGLFSLFADDKYSKCHRGAFPIHKYVGNNFKCQVPKEKRGNDACTRMCGFDVEDSYEFNYTGFRSNWCSHVILSTANVEGTGGLGIPPSLKFAVNLFNRWNTDQKPFLIVSIGKRDTNDRWRMSIGSPHSRSLLIHNIKQFTMENEIDGIDISWTLGKIDSAIDMKFFNNFLKELRNKLPHTLIIVSVTPLTTYNSRYNVSTLNTTADFILLEGHRFHTHNNWFTGHHSPLFVNSQLLQDPKMTIEGFALDWISRGINSQKLIIGLTAEGMAMSFFNTKSDERTIGQRANPASVRAINGGKISQTEICEMKRNETTKVKFIDDLGVPYLFKGSDFVAYDDEKSIQIKSVWASFGKYGGIALFNVEKDNIDGECPPNEPFPLLKTIVKTQVCDSCEVYKKQNVNATVDECNPRFKISCNYRLPTSRDTDLLEPEKIPFHHCTEIVVEEDTLDEDGGVHQELAEIAVNYRQKLIDAAKFANFTNLIFSIRCNLTEEKFSNLMDKSSEVVNSIRKYVDKNGFRGVELKCDNLLNPKNKAKFDSFLKTLKENFDVKDSENAEQCGKTVSIRVPVWTTNLNDGYETVTLNSLSHVTLEPFQTSAGKSQLVSPLFGHVGEDQLAIDSTIKAWVASGLTRSSIIVSLPSYGIVQKLSDNRQMDHGIGSQTQVDFIDIISQNQVCAKLSRPGTHRKPLYDFVATYATTVNNEWISFETQETVKYKLKYAIRENLGGIGFMSLNEDDFANVCKQGVFPILEVIAESTCQV